MLCRRTLPPIRPRRPLTVGFADASTGDPAGWRWDFGGGTGSAERSPWHTYDESGVYTVSPTVVNGTASNTSAHRRIAVMEASTTSSVPSIAPVSTAAG